MCAEGKASVMTEWLNELKRVSVAVLLCFEGLWERLAKKPAEWTEGLAKSEGMKELLLRAVLKVSEMNEVK